MSAIFMLAPVLAVTPVLLSVTASVAATLGCRLLSQKVDDYRTLPREGSESEDMVRGKEVEESQEEDGTIRLRLRQWD